MEHGYAVLGIYVLFVDLHRVAYRHRFERGVYFVELRLVVAEISEYRSRFVRYLYRVRYLHILKGAAGTRYRIAVLVQLFRLVEISYFPILEIFHHGRRRRFVHFDDFAYRRVLYDRVHVRRYFAQRLFAYFLHKFARGGIFRSGFLVVYDRHEIVHRVSAEIPERFVYRL